MYLYHLISIDLESSRSCNSSHCKSLQLWARLALSAAPTVKQSSFKKSLLPPHLQCPELLHLPNGRTIEHRPHRTSIASGIDHIEHRSYRTSIEPNPTVRTRPYEPDNRSNDQLANTRSIRLDRSNRTSNIENRTSKIEHQKSNIENRKSNIDQTKRTTSPTDDRTDQSNQKFGTSK